MTKRYDFRWTRMLPMIALLLLLSGCGFHLRGDMPLASPLHSLHIQAINPYGTLVRNLEQSLKMSGAHLTDNATDAQTILIISHDSTFQELLSVGATQQTRQYKLTAVVTFEVADKQGRNIVPPQTLADSRVITVQSNQILGSSNEANLYFQQMQRGLATSIMYRLSSHQITSDINKAFNIHPAKKQAAPRKKRRT